MAGQGHRLQLNLHLNPARLLVPLLVELQVELQVQLLVLPSQQPLLLVL